MVYSSDAYLLQGVLHLCTLINVLLGEDLLTLMVFFRRLKRRTCVGELLDKGAGGAFPAAFQG